MTLAPIVLFPGSTARGPVPDLDIKFVGSPNFFSGWGGHQPIAIVVHTMAGSLEGTDATFNDPHVPDDKRVSAHFGVALDGRVHQYVSLNDRAWANGILDPGNTWFGEPGVNPNSLTVSIETEDRGVNSTPVSDQLYTSVAGLVQLIVHTFPTIAFLTSHHVISPQSRPNCCGKRWTAPAAPGGTSRLAQLAQAARLELRV